MSIKLPVLYHRSRTGKLHSWDIWTEGADIVTKYGQIDGKKQTARKAAVGKNIGRSNETTPAQQADSEAQSMWNFKRDRKYSENPDDAQDTVYLPMLAQKFEKKKHKVKYPVDVQPKLDGVRCMAFWDGDDIILMSRSGKEYPVEHIKEALKKMAFRKHKSLVLDGELYIHGVSLQNINSLVKKPKDGTENVCYHIYDVVNIDEEETWEQRKWNIHKVFANKYCPPKIVRVWTREAKTEHQVYEYQVWWVEGGYEGAIVRTAEYTYNWGHRSPGLLKVKSFLDDEFKIIGFRDGIGKFKGVCIWICEVPSGKTFEVTQKGTMDERKQLFKEAEQHIGSMLKVQYQTLTDGGIPQFPVGLAIRLEEDM